MASVSKFGQIAQAARRGADRALDRRPRRSEPFADFQHRADVEYERSLSKLIESEIIPRLLVAHGGVGQATGDVGQDAGVSAEEVEAFAPLSLQVEADELIEHVRALVARGVSMETLLVDLLAPSARLLGQFWEDDRCDFVDVTMGLWRLQEVVHELSSLVPADRQHPGRDRRALFASMPGDQHSFGTVVVDELFSANGWMTDRISEASITDLTERVREEWFDLAGLTISWDYNIGALPALIRMLRESSRNSQICVMVGGRVFVDNAALAENVGADGTAPDARLAVRVAGELVDAVAREAVSPMSG